MPVNTLLVEGKLDAEVLGKILGDVTTIQSGRCSKNELAPRVRTERRGNKPFIFYLRDRDYDFPPPLDETSFITPELPDVDRWDDVQRQCVLGWRWRRHSLECYMLEPSIVSAATGIDGGECLTALCDAGRSIRHYQAARWAIGSARRSLPPNHEFQTFPLQAGSKEFFLPDDLSVDASLNWSCAHASAFLSSIADALNETAVEQTFHTRVRQFDGDFLESVGLILKWFSGKDLMTALKDWLSAKGIGSPGDFRTILADWIYDHPDKTLELLPEWRSFKEYIRTYP